MSLTSPGRQSEHRFSSYLSVISARDSRSSGGEFTTIVFNVRTADVRPLRAVSRAISIWRIISAIPSPDLGVFHPTDFAWPRVARGGDCFGLVAVPAGEVGALREVLTQQPGGVLVRIAAELLALGERRVSDAMPCSRASTACSTFAAVVGA